MRITVITQAGREPVSGLIAVLSQPFSRMPEPAALRRVPAANRGVTGADGSVTLQSQGLAGEVQLTLARLRGGVLDLLHRQVFGSADALPATLEIVLGKSDAPDQPGAAGPVAGRDDARPAGARPTPRDAEGRDGPARPDLTDAGYTPVRVPSLGGFAARQSTVSEAASRDLQQGLAPAFARRAKQREEAQGFARKLLSPVPGVMPRGGAFLADRQKLVPEVKRAQQEGVARMKRRAAGGRGMLLRGGAASALGQGGQVKLSDLVARLPGASFAGRITRRLQPSQLVRAARAAAPAPEAGTPAAPADDNPRPSRAELLNEIAQRLARLPETTRADPATIAANLEAELAVGPADQAAYYDFPVLRVAWKDIWERAFDAKTQDEIVELYQEIVKIVPPEAVPKGDQAEVTELRDMLTELSGIVAEATASTVVPQELIIWLPELAESWVYLSLSDQELVRCLYHVDTFCQANKYRWADDFIRRDFETVGGKTDDRDRFFYRFWKAYPSTTERDIEYPMDFMAGNGVYDIEEPVQESATEEKWLHVAFLRYIAQTGVTLTDYPEEFADYPEGWLPSESIFKIAEDQIALEAARDIANSATEAGGTSPLGRAEDLINQLQRRSDTPYGFDVFAEDSHNFGVITTYRQKWQPLAYQAGDLAGTLPLAPNERRSFTVTRKETTRTKRSETSTSSTVRSSESAETNRAEAEIARRVTSALSADVRIDSNFHGGFLGNGGELAFGGGGSTDLANESNQTKTELRETTRKAAQEYRDERKLEVSTETESSWESTVTREISNPNNEITVTYLFYELQRRFEVSERLYDIIPVVLVAMPMPKPDQIHETWLLQHSWILRDILLDPALAPVLAELSENFAGDELAVEIMEVQWTTQMQVVADLRLQMKSHVLLREQARAAMEAASAEVISVEEGSKKEVGSKVAEQLFGASEATEAARQALDWADADLGGADAALREAIGALEQATTAYVEAVKARLNRRVRIDHLILHIKTNILHYMQEIWRREPAGQRYLRIYDLKIAWSDLVEVTPVTSATARAAVTASGSLARVVPAAGMPSSPIGLELAERPVIDAIKFEPVSLEDEVELHEVADLDTILGFRGNYAAFRLTEPNAITTFMVQDFLDSHFGLFDPDPLGEIPTAQEALAIAAKAWARPDITDEQKEQIADWLVEALEAAHLISQVIAVPSGELFVEALPGAHPVLEDFKLLHRAADVARAQAEAAQAEVEVQRRVARIEAGDLEDPDVDRFVRVEGANVTVTEGG